eukprot:5203694-Pyramimonas_sp.AAC.1
MRPLDDAGWAECGITRDGKGGRRENELQIEVLFIFSLHWRRAHAASAKGALASCGRVQILAVVSHDHIVALRTASRHITSASRRKQFVSWCFAVQQQKGGWARMLGNGGRETRAPRGGMGCNAGVGGRRRRKEKDDEACGLRPRSKDTLQ